MAFILNNNNTNNNNNHAKFHADRWHRRRDIPERILALRLSIKTIIKLPIGPCVWDILLRHSVGLNAPTNRQSD